MKDSSLRRRRILIVEDEFLIAQDLQAGLEDHQAVVLGPVATVRQGLELVAAEPQLDAALLDVNLGGESVFPLADKLIAQNTVVVFTTGYDPHSVLCDYAGARCHQKPLIADQIARELAEIFQAREKKGAASGVAELRIG